MNTKETIRLLLSKIVDESGHHSERIAAFHAAVEHPFDDSLSDLEKDAIYTLAYDLDFFVESDERRREDPSDYGIARLDVEVRRVMKVLSEGTR